MSENAVSPDRFKKLSRYVTRRFIPENADLRSPQVITKLFEELLNKEIHSSVDLSNWLAHRGELESALDQEGSILYVLMTCQTDHASYAQDYKNFIERIVPVVKPLDDKLNQKYIKASAQYSPDKSFYSIYDRKLKSDIELFVEKNIPLQTQLDLLSQEYQSICGSMTVVFEGREQTLPQMSKYLLEPNRDLREKSWKAVAGRRLTEKDKLDKVFDQMLILRHQVAINAGFKNYRDYMFKALHRFDYTPDDCKQYHHTMETIVLPLWKKMSQHRMQVMNLTPLRPWDLAVDPLGRKPLKPFSHVNELIDGCQKIFSRVHPVFGQQFAEINQDGLLDLESRKGKAPGGYQTSLKEARRPFIFMNSVGLESDIRTLLHEGGHAFHSLACSTQPLVDYRHGPMEFNEVASMGMELLGGEFISEFYKNDAEIKRSFQEHLEGIVSTLIWVAIVDCFQHWIYENPTHTAVERKNKWLSIRKRFSSNDVSWEHLEEEHAYLWHRQLHIFEVPFYYIEYGIAQIGALQLWLNAQKNRDKAVESYRTGLSLGGSRPLPELFNSSGIIFDFSAKTISPLMEAIETEWKKII